MSKRTHQLIRVTSVLDYVESKWKEFWWRKVGFEAADKIGRDSAEFGRSVHSLIEASLKGMNIEPESEEQALCANAVLEYLQKNGITPLFETYDKSLEIEVVDKKLGLVGHFDYAANVNGVPTIIDFKTSNKMRKSFPLQKAAYAKMTNTQFGTKIDQGLTLRSHWDKEEKKVVFEDKLYPNLIKKYWPLFKMCLSLYVYFTRKEK